MLLLFNYLGEITAIATAFCWAVTSIFFSYGGRQVGSVVVNLSRLLFAFLMMASTHFFLFGDFLPVQAEPFRWGWLGLSALLGFVIGDSGLFQAFILVGPRLASLIMALVPIFSTFFGWLFFGETVTYLEFTGIILTISGVAWVVTEKRGRTQVENKLYGQGIIFGLVGVLGQASGLITSKFGLVDGFPPASANVIRILAGMTILWLLAAFRGQVGFTIKQWRHKKALYAIWGGTLTGPFAGVWLSLTAIQLTRVGIAATLMALTPIMVIPLSYFIFGERITVRSIVGTIVAVIGVALIFA